MATEDLAAGRLVQPFDLELPSECAYYFVAPEVSADQPKIQAFRDWLLQEVDPPRAASGAAAAERGRCRGFGRAARHRAGSAS